MTAFCTTIHKFSWELLHCKLAITTMSLFSGRDAKLEVQNLHSPEDKSAHTHTHSQQRSTNYMPPCINMFSLINFFTHSLHFHWNNEKGFKWWRQNCIYRRLCIQYSLIAFQTIKQTHLYKCLRIYSIIGESKLLPFCYNFLFGCTTRKLWVLLNQCAIQHLGTHPPRQENTLYYHCLPTWHNTEDKHPIKRYFAKTLQIMGFTWQFPLLLSTITAAHIAYGLHVTWLLLDDTWWCLAQWLSPLSARSRSIQKEECVTTWHCLSYADSIFIFYHLFTMY